MNTTEPHPIHNRRTTTLFLVTVTAVVAAVVIVSGIIADHTTKNRTHKTTHRCVTPATAPNSPGVPANTSPNGGGLTVTERGFTQIINPFSYERPGATVSLGAVVRNTSHLVAYRTRITLRITDSTGAPADSPTSGELLRQEIPIIMPGQSVTVGGWSFVRIPKQGRMTRNPVTVTAFDVDLTSTHWLPTKGFAPIATTHRTTERRAFETKSGSVEGSIFGTVRFTTVSPYCRDLALRGVAILFRNTKGILVGGTFDQGTKRICEAGTSDGLNNASRSLPFAIDTTRTEVEPYCDIAAVRNDWKRGQPIN